MVRICIDYIPNPKFRQNNLNKLIGKNKNPQSSGREKIQPKNKASSNIKKGRQYKGNQSISDKSHLNKVHIF